MATAAIFACRHADAFRRVQQVDTFDWQSRLALAVGAAVVVAHQAIDVIRVGEVKILVFPAVAGVAGCAVGPVAKQ